MDRNHRYRQHVPSQLREGFQELLVTPLGTTATTTNIQTHVPLLKLGRLRGILRQGGKQLTVLVADTCTFVRYIK